MSERLVVLGGLGLWLGVALLVAPLRWFRRPPLVTRLRPYAPGGASHAPREGAFSIASLREIATPLSTAIGERLARMLGVGEELAVRLRRIHAPLDVAAFRIRQLGWSLVAVVLAAGGALAVGLPAAPTLVLLLVAPLLAFLVLEQQVVAASEARQRRLLLELPVVAEQLGMLLSAGWSLGAALGRLGERGHGVAAEDLRDVTTRMRQGLSDVAALREWADLAGVDALGRLVGVLSLNREASDLGALVAEEARAIRRDVHRELLEAIERKGQQVWIPVTVAALVPGAILIAVPFIHAMRAFAGS